MKFTRYFSATIKNNGIPQINTNEYSKLFNIITLESRIDELYRLKDKETNNGRKYKLKIRIFELKETLHWLTMENSPKNIMKYMLNQSKFEN
ncbi:hypothetical protein [Sediminibacter sp. Hel_I_10]|uniref:hypothetical protein n=1 Tax=Sediminibacter sp. Hel_I_10 TaxID=1392490 RepID=UPI00047AA668|nr:hypothetical protein [Sediminibacter sp. Hel_I_10]